MTFAIPTHHPHEHLFMIESHPPSATGQAVDLEPQNSAYSLNYLHAIELDQQFDDVVTEVSRFCTVTDLALGGQLSSVKVSRRGLACRPLHPNMYMAIWKVRRGLHTVSYDG